VCKRITSCSTKESTVDGGSDGWKIMHDLGPKILTS